MSFVQSSGLLHLSLYYFHPLSILFLLRNIPLTSPKPTTWGKQTTRLTKFEQREIRNLFFFLNKTNHTNLWRLFFSWQLCGQSDSFRPVEVVLNHQLLPSFIRFLSLRTPTTPSTHHFSAREPVRGDPANMPTKKEMWHMIQFLSCHIFISCYMLFDVICLSIS